LLDESIRAVYGTRYIKGAAEEKYNEMSALRREWQQRTPVVSDPLSSLTNPGVLTLR
jgi:hypothetical protein